MQNCCDWGQVIKRLLESRIGTRSGAYGYNGRYDIKSNDRAFSGRTSRRSTVFQNKQSLTHFATEVRSRTLHGMALLKHFLFDQKVGKTGSHSIMCDSSVQYHFTRNSVTTIQARPVPRPQPNPQVLIDIRNSIRSLSLHVLKSKRRVVCSDCRTSIV